MQKYKVDKEKEKRDVAMIKQTGLLMGINNTLKKIYNHGKQDQKPSRTRR